MKKNVKHRHLAGIARHLTPRPSVWDNFHEGVIMTDADGLIAYYNRMQAEIDDIAPEEALGKLVTELYRVDEGLSPVLNCLQSGKAILNLACYYRTRLGKVVNSIHNIYPLYENQRLAGAICFVRDYRLAEQIFDTVSKPRRNYDRQSLAEVPPRRPPGGQPRGTRFTFEDIVGQDAGLVQAVEAARLSSRSPSPIMLLGETGTGKELFAQAIHADSLRWRRQYVAINCAAIPENLLEGMPFGTSKGAFTGAMDKPGLFERANSGTLFLDEINSMPVNLQAKLLRVLQEKQVRRVGSLDETPVDLKIISSVNLEPHQAIAEGTLRPDLFYRLAVVFIRIPPLRERLSDLNRLVGHFLSKCNAAFNQNITAISADVMERFRHHHWPGNVRELEHVIEGAMNMVGDHEIIEVVHLSGHINEMTAPSQLSDTVDRSDQASFRQAQAPSRPRGRINYVFPSESVRPPAPARRGLAQMQASHEIEAIRRALAATHGNASRAARRLNISPQLLHYKMKKYHIDRREFLT